ncbi:hypothetical protein BGW38_005222 [Lunasporangiospora selenospora]|uniref:NADH dehydrogenase [ubiquinone] 1 alpha subcomplex assembly factor 3 n=1 Tax=Lunasporangiospora selenospora TaxID=979761 RepID=A0A9P6FNA3_9FUNG|nr:hypothetical protein BGW38_005222 [Lunasporangiospora selenospora]
MLASALKRTAGRVYSVHAGQLVTHLKTRSSTCMSRLSTLLASSTLSAISRSLTTTVPRYDGLSQPPPQPSQGLRQKPVPAAGHNEDADNAISGFMNMFDDKDSRTVTITVCTKHGFVTTEAITLQGPVLCIGGQVFLWDVYKEGGAIDQMIKATSATGGAGASNASSSPLPARSILENMDEATAKDIFKVFEVMSPRPEILIVGTGKTFAPLSPAVRSVIRNLGIQVDMMSTANAAATYNMLAEEGREVAAALLPLEPSTAHYVRSGQQ